MIIKILKGRSFGGLLDYLFDPQHRPAPQEIDVKGSPGRQHVSDELPSPGSWGSEKDRAGRAEENLRNGPAKGNQRGDQDDSGKTEHEQRGELIVTNMAGRSKEELREHFEALAALRPGVGVNVLHGILSFPEEDVLSRETKVRIVLRFAKLKGLDRTMFAAIEHEEERHRHTEIHVISSTIDFKGRLPSDSFDYDRGEAIARQLEKEFNLKPNRPSRDAMSRGSMYLFAEPEVPKESPFFHVHKSGLSADHILFLRIDRDTDSPVPPFRIFQPWSASTPAAN